MSVNTCQQLILLYTSALLLLFFAFHEPSSKNLRKVDLRYTHEEAFAIRGQTDSRDVAYKIDFLRLGVVGCGVHNMDVVAILWNTKKRRERVRINILPSQFKGEKKKKKKKSSFLPLLLLFFFFFCCGDRGGFSNPFASTYQP